MEKKKHTPKKDASENEPNFIWKSFDGHYAILSKEQWERLKRKHKLKDNNFNYIDFKESSQPKFEIVPEFTDYFNASFVVIFDDVKYLACEFLYVKHFSEQLEIMQLITPKKRFPLAFECYCDLYVILSPWE